MRFAGTLVLLAMAAGAQQRPDPGKGVNFYSIEKEVALGKQLADEFRARTHALENAAVLAYVDAIAQRLAAQIGGPEFHYTIALIADDPTSLHEIAAFPGGFLFVPSSLILAAENEDEFAGMLAHAIAHVASRDATRQATKAELMQTANAPLIAMGGWTGYAIEQGSTAAIPVAMRQMRRRFELNADSLAVGAMAAAGYDPAALARYIERVQPADDGTNRFDSALPRRSQRLEALRAAIGELPPRTYPSHEGFTRIQGEIRRMPPRSR
jgi:predicted Zn-dependent protease